MISFTRHIQEACKPVLWVLFSVLLLVNCGKDEVPTVQALNFQDSSVSFQNNSCTAGVTLINGSGEIYTLSFLSASFKDANDDTYETEFDQNQVIDAFDPVSIAPGATSEGTMVFDLQGQGLTPPLHATVVLVGIAGGQVTHFVGNFTCE